MTRGLLPIGTFGPRSRAIPGDRAAGGRPVLADQYGRGPAVVLLHGQPGSALDWHQVVPLLSPGFTTIVPDRPGYGRTGGKAAGFEANAVALAALLDRLAVKQALMVGYSWGGGVALAFAEFFPERTAGLVLAACIGPGERFGWQARIQAAPLVGEVLAGLTLGVPGRLLASVRMQTVADRRLRGRAREALKVLAGATGAGTGAAVWRSVVLEQRVLLRDLDPLGPGLAAITAPAEVINGSADRVVPPPVAAALTSRIPGATHTVVAGADHLLLRDRPDEVASAVRRVARRAWGPAASERPALDVEEAPDGEIGAQDPDPRPDYQ